MQEFKDDNDGVSSVVEKQRKFFASAQTREFAFRSDALLKVEKYLINHREQLLQALAEDLRKPALEAFLAEYYFLLQEVRLIRKGLKKWMKPKKVKCPIYFQPCKSSVVREPFGVILIIAPWNYPIQLAISPLIAAIAAGNTVVLKPSEVSTASERFLVEMVAECFDAEYVATVTGGVDVAQRLLETKFDFIFYTGSTEVGKIVAGQAAKNLTPVVLELGGKCPCIIDETVDLDMAAKRVLSGKFFNAGQTCFAPDFVVVHDSVKDAFVKACEDLLANTPWDQEMGSIINENHYQRLQKVVSGKQCIQQGDDRPAEQFMAPRLIPDVTWSDDLMQQEVFGPILPILTYQNGDELLSRLAKFESPLALYIFSQNEQWVSSVLDILPSGAVCINDTMKQGSSLELPFGGVGASGYGRYRGLVGLDSMSYERAIVKRYNFSFKPMDIIPPYGKAYTTLKKWMR